MYIPTRKQIATWAGYALIGASGTIIGATVATLRANTSAPAPAKPKPLEAFKVTVFRSGTKGHLYRVGIFDGEEWEPIDSVAYVDELMAMRLRVAASAWGTGGDGITIHYPAEGIYLSLLAAPHVTAPDQIGRLFMVRGEAEVLFLLAKCKEIIDGGAGVQVELEAIA